MSFLLIVGIFSIKNINAKDIDNLGCLLGRNINSKIDEVRIKPTIYGYDAVSKKPVPMPDSTPFNESMYILEDIKASLTNDGSIHEGDFFTYQLDHANRLGGFQKDGNIPVADIYVELPDGSSVLFAHAILNNDENLITYVLTDFIETQKKVEFSVQEAWTIKPYVVADNGERTFADTFATTPHTYKYTVDYGANFDDPYKNNNFSLVSRMLFIDQVTNTYEQIFLLNPKNTELPQGFELSYISGAKDNKYLSPLDGSAVIKVYEVEDGYKIPDTFGVNFSELKDVTDSLTVGTGIQGFKKFTFSKATTKRYIIHLTNKYISNQTTAPDGSMLEAQETINSGFLVTTKGLPNEPHYVYNQILILKKLL